MYTPVHIDLVTRFTELIALVHNLLSVSLLLRMIPPCKIQKSRFNVKFEKLFLLLFLQRSPTPSSMARKNITEMTEMMAVVEL